MPGRKLSHKPGHLCPPSHSLPPWIFPKLAADSRENCSSEYPRNWDTHCSWSQWQGQKYRGKAAEAGGQYYWKDNSHRHTTGFSQPTLLAPIQADVGGKITALHLDFGEVLGFQGLFRGSNPICPSHPLTIAEPWDLSNLVIEETHTSWEKRGIFFCH